MYLRDLAVYASDAAEFPRGRTCRDFNMTTHAPVEAYLDLLPRRTVCLGDLAKVNIVVGPRPPAARSYFAALNVAIAYWPWFDFGRYFALSRAGQQRRVITVLHKSLLRIAKRTGSDPVWYEAAFAALGGMTFPLPEIMEYELRRRHGVLLSHEKKHRRRRPCGASSAGS
jgi:hypothetical protein